MITSIHNPRVKAARKLVDRKERYAAGMLLAEGVRMIGDAVKCGIEPVVVFYDPQAAEANAAATALLAALEAAGTECQPCTPEVFATLTSTVTPQGLVAVLPLPLNLPVPTPLTFALVLDAVRDPGNAGTLLRSAAAAGVQAVIFGPQTVDPFNDKVLRAGMGTHFRVPLRICATWEQVRQILGPGLNLYLAEAAAQLAYDRVDWHIPCGLVVGGEASGAGAAARTASTAIAIPMHSGVESLNAAVAGSVILFEAARQRRKV